MLTDTHCHLDFDWFDEDREQVLARAWDAGVKRILIPAIDLASCMRAIELAESDSRIFAAVGVHPNSATTWREDTISILRQFSRHPKVVAIGEIGLDYYRDRAPRDLQRKVLRAQLELAAEVRLPVVIHNREASEDLFAILREWHGELVSAKNPLRKRPGVLHSFSAGSAYAEQAVHIGFYLGFTGPVTFKKAQTLRNVVAQLPLERILVETDAPFLSPHPHRGKRNEPAFVRLVAEKIADVRQCSLAAIVEQTGANAACLFEWG